MEFFRIRRDIPFMRHALVFNVISLLTFLAAVFFLATRGLHFSIEFTGGTVIEAAYAQAADIAKVRTRGRDARPRRSAGAELRQLARRADPRAGARRREAVRRRRRASSPSCAGPRAARSRARGRRPAQAASRRRAQVCSAGGAEPVRLQRSEVVGPQVGRELAEDGAKALAFVVIGIMIYLAFRFEWKFSVAAIVANLHDVVIILGFFAFFQWEFSLSVLAGGARGARLFGQRVGHHLRPDPRVVPALPQAQLRTRSSTTRSRARSAAPSSPTARPR